jgi:hypothetical protein
MINDATIAENKVFCGVIARDHNWNSKGEVDVVAYQENHRVCITPQALDKLLVVDLGLRHI